MTKMKPLFTEMKWNPENCNELYFFKTYKGFAI